MKLLLLSDLDFLETLSQRELVKVMCLLMGSVYVMDMTFKILSNRCKTDLSDIELVKIGKLDATEFGSAMELKKDIGLHITDCAVLKFCTLNDLVLVTEDNALKNAASKYGVTTMDCNHLYGLLTQQKIS